MPSTDENFYLVCRAFNFGDFVDGKAQQPIPESLTPYESQFGTFCASNFPFTSSTSVHPDPNACRR